MRTIITTKDFENHSPLKMDANEYNIFNPYIQIVKEFYFKGKEVEEKHVPALVCYAVYQALPFHWSILVKKGISIPDAEDIDIMDIASVRIYVKNKADSLINELNKE